MESLEGRDLMSDIPGVCNQAGVLVITATQDAHNTAIVSNEQNGNVQVTLNGNREVFPAGALWTISYTGGQGGRDKFTNNTNLSEVNVMYGGGNQVFGGTSWNLAYLWGNNNSFDSSGGGSEVFTYGSNNNINTQDAPVALYAYDVPSASIW
ncbi:MAG: hypothetical protein ACLQDL_00405 [Spirochaetia bacterium]